MAVNLSALIWQGSSDCSVNWNTNGQGMAASSWDGGLVKHFSTAYSQMKHGEIWNRWWQEEVTWWCLQRVTCPESLSIIHWKHCRRPSRYIWCRNLVHLIIKRKGLSSLEICMEMALIKFTWSEKDDVCLPIHANLPLAVVGSLEV